MKFDKFSEALEHYTSKLPYSASDIADKLGISVPYYRDIKAERRIPKFDIAFKCTEVFGQTDSYWLSILIRASVKKEEANAQTVADTLKIPVFEKTIDGDFSKVTKPSELLKKILDGNQVSYLRLQNEAEIMPSTVWQILNENNRITVKLSFKLARYFSKTEKINNPYFWLRLQKNLDIEQHHAKKSL